MNKKWILSLIPVSLIIMVVIASGQSTQFSNAVAGTENPVFKHNIFSKDTTFTPFPTDSTYANLQIGWNKTPGQMPIYFFGLPPNSMPILMSPPVDEGMIQPMGIEGKVVPSDSLRIPIFGNE